MNLPFHPNTSGHKVRKFRTTAGFFGVGEDIYEVILQEEQIDGVRHSYTLRPGGLLGSRENLSIQISGPTDKIKNLVRSKKGFSYRVVFTNYGDGKAEKARPVLAAFVSEIKPQIDKRYDNESAVPIQSPGFNFDNEEFDVDDFLVAPQVEQFDMICRAVCGVNYDNPRTQGHQLIVRALKIFRKKIEKQ
jgi:hypothetical protein